MGEEGKEGYFDAGVMEDASRGKQQQQPDDKVSLVGRGLHDHRLADKAAKEREGRNRRGPDHAEAAGPRHGFVQPPEIRAVDPAGAVEHRAHRHKKQTFEEHVVEGVGNRAVDAHTWPQADADNHKADLVDHAVAQHAAQIIFNNRIEDGKHRHGRADVEQAFGAGKTARQHIDRGLGGKGAQKNRAGGRGLRVGIHQPRVQEWEGAFNANAEEDQPRGPAIDAQMPQRQRTSLLVVPRRADQKQQARADVDQEVARARGNSPFALVGPNLEDRANRQQLPEDEERDEIAGKNRTHGRARVQEAGRLLQPIFQMQREERGEEGGHVKEIAKEQAELVNAHPVQLVAS